MKVNHSNYKDYAGAVPDHEQVAGDGGGREGRSAAVKAVHYQEFINGRGGGGEKKTERTERKASARSVKSNYVYFIVKRSDGSTLILPIIKV